MRRGPRSKLTVDRFEPCVGDGARRPWAMSHLQWTRGGRPSLPTLGHTLLPSPLLTAVRPCMPSGATQPCSVQPVEPPACKGSAGVLKIVVVSLCIHKYKGCLQRIDLCKALQSSHPS